MFSEDGCPECGPNRNMLPAKHGGARGRTASPPGDLCFVFAYFSRMGYVFGEEGGEGASFILTNGGILSETCARMHLSPSSDRPFTFGKVLSPPHAIFHN